MSEVDDRSRVPFLDLTRAHRELADEIGQAVTEVCESGRYLLGPRLELFEAQFAEYVGAEYCVGVGSGLDALYLALRASGIGSDDEVIVPSFTFIATWLSISRCGAQPIPVEVDARTGCMDPQAVLNAIGPRTRAIIPVHLYGNPAELASISAIADEHGLLVIEDAAQAHGARIGSDRVGGCGTTAAWSFYPSKNLGAFGDAGAVTTDNSELAASLRLLRNYGTGEKYNHVLRGVNSRLDEIQAAVLSVKLAHLDEWNGRRAQVAMRYLTEITTTKVTLPYVASDTSPSWHLFVVQVEDRSSVQSFLTEQGIETLIHYPIPVHRQVAYANPQNSQLELSVTDAMARRVISLPMGPHLSDAQVDLVIGVLDAATKRDVQHIEPS